MGYLHINNLYRDQDILLFKECYAMEKIHGTSAHLAFREGRLHLFPGGESQVRFDRLFDQATLEKQLVEFGADVTIYGEAYGGSQQRQAWRYGADLRFVAFDVMISERWLSVPQAADVVARLGLQFVHYRRIAAELAAIDAERDAPSEQARRNGVVGDQPREGVVLRPLIELTKNNESRILAKHKRAEERETGTPREVADPALLAVLTNAESIALEWVTVTRLDHVLDKLGPVGIERTGDVVKAMVEDVLREGAGEIVDSKEARQAIGRRTAHLFKARATAIPGTV